MTCAAILALAAATGAQASAYATARIVRGERISLEAQAPGPDRQLREIRRRERPDAPPATFRLIEFQ